jgi:hypothetical protein
VVTVSRNFEHQQLSQGALQGTGQEHGAAVQSVRPGEPGDRTKPAAFGSWEQSVTRVKMREGGSFLSQLHRNERRFDSLSGKFDAISPETSAVGPLISISLKVSNRKSA